MASHAEWTPQSGDRLFIPCRGGPCTSRLVYYPPPLEVEERGGLYVLNDDGEKLSGSTFSFPLSSARTDW